MWYLHRYRSLPDYASSFLQPNKAHRYLLQIISAHRNSLPFIPSGSPLKFLTSHTIGSSCRNASYQLGRPEGRLRPIDLDHLFKDADEPKDVSLQVTLAPSGSARDNRWTICYGPFDVQKDEDDPFPWKKEDSVADNDNTFFKEDGEPNPPRYFSHGHDAKAPSDSRKPPDDLENSPETLGPTIGSNEIPPQNNDSTSEVSEHPPKEDGDPDSLSEDDVQREQKSNCMEGRCMQAREAVMTVIRVVVPLVFFLFRST
ncbi:hypothetical protein BDZ97DRAFT_1770720 [Flammula alnicola]|nr:hypothetical protein BDZ97DRAFT_1770720 [Flammula alnicola]